LPIYPQIRLQTSRRGRVDNGMGKRQKANVRERQLLNSQNSQLDSTVSRAEVTIATSNSHPGLASEKNGTTVITPQSEREKRAQDVVEKYRELYTYSTDVLLKEHERFIKADDKASRYSTIFVFLLGICGYFEKWGFDHITKDANRVINLPEEWPLILLGAVALVLSGIGWFLANRAIMLRPFANRPLNSETIGFFDKQSLLNIYDSFSRRNVEIYQMNTAITNKKHTVIERAHKLMVIVLFCLVGIGVMYCLYSVL